MLSNHFIELEGSQCTIGCEMADTSLARPSKSGSFADAIPNLLGARHAFEREAVPGASSQATGVLSLQCLEEFAVPFTFDTMAITIMFHLPA